MNLKLGVTKAVARTVRCNSTTTKIPLKTLDQMPGLKKLPLIGTLHHFMPVIGSIGMTQNMFDLFGVFHKKYGSVVKMDVFARSTMVILFEPEDYEKVYRAEETNPLRPGFETLEHYRTVLKKEEYSGVYGLMTAQGDKWRDFRTKVNPALLKLKLVKVYTPGLEEIAQEFIDGLSKLKDDTKYIENNMDSELTRWSLESVAFVGLGTRLGCLQDDLTELHPAQQLMNCSKNIMRLAFILEMMPNFWKVLPTSTYKKIIETFDIQYTLSKKYIDQAKERLKNRKGEVMPDEESIVEKLLAVDDRVAAMMGNEMLLAGIDTVSFAVIGLLYHLAKNQDKQAKLREELNSKEPNKRYLKACLKESLRFWPVIPANLRRTSKEHVVNGYLIPKGVEVIAPNEYLSKLEKYYPRPLEFIPERWLVEKSDPLYYGQAHPMVTLPFGFGVRSCIGRRIAELEIEIMVERLIKQFCVKWDGAPITVETKLMNSFKKPFFFRFENL